MAFSALQFFHQFCFIGTNGWTPVMWALPWKPSPPKWFLIRRCQHRSFLASFTSVIKIRFLRHSDLIFIILLLQHSKIQAWVWWKAVQTFFKSFVRNSWILLRWVFLVEKMRFLSSVSKMHEKEITDFLKEKSSSNWCGCMAWTMLYVIFHLTMNSA